MADVYAEKFNSSVDVVYAVSLKGRKNSNVGYYATYLERN